MTRRAMKPDKQAAPQTRLAEVHTWNPDTRTERIVRARKLPFTGDPAALIRAAARLLPQWKPFGLGLHVFTGEIPGVHLGPGPLMLYFCRDASGTEWSVNVTITEADQATFAAFLLLRCRATVMGLLKAPYPDEGREGESLPVPEIALVQAVGQSPALVS